MNDKPIYVTQPFLPPIEEFEEYLRKIWENKVLTNNGPFHQEFEDKLAKFLGVKYVSLFTNGTLALITALQALGIKGEVITTPYSFVATSHALTWNGIKPVFCDIERDGFNLDPQQIEKHITSNTSAILPVHVYGIPCNDNEISEIAKKYGLKVIYDAAHAFNVKMNDAPVLNFGDLSIVSFHATKVFNTFEGGAIVTDSPMVKEQIDYLKNFGFADEVTVVGAGINAKMSEIQSAMGILQLKYFHETVLKRKKVSEFYTEALSNIKEIKLMELPKDLDYNYSYFPILLDEVKLGFSRDYVYEKLKSENIFTRRYFYPLISNFPQYINLESSKKENLPHAEETASKVLCLPLYPNIKRADQLKIIESFRNL
jgi:dTDP-4-amino-4,6-dideoxygalactose transaminase